MSWESFDWKPADGVSLGAGASILPLWPMLRSAIAEAISADLLVISTPVEKVSLNYGKPNEQTLDTISAAEARRYVAEGHFQPGSMLPKVQACLQFLEAGGREALITSPAALAVALDGKTGTRVVP